VLISSSLTAKISIRGTKKPKDKKTTKRTIKYHSVNLKLIFFSMISKEILIKIYHATIIKGTPINGRKVNRCRNIFPLTSTFDKK
jgi:hypothetical protein